MIARTPSPPYYAVIFSTEKTSENEGYEAMSARMVQLAAEQPGFLGVESARDGLGITVSYWESLESIQNWKQQADHLEAQQKGRTTWYRAYKTRICKVERDYGFENF